MPIYKEIMDIRAQLTRLSSIAILCAIIICISSLHSFADNNARQSGSDNKGSGISFNFVEVEIPSVIKFISEITGFNFVFDERIRGKITIIAPTRLSILRPPDIQDHTVFNG
jgi:general secretion pathway protein D